ncbi:energy transducer TonB [Enterovibrio coralii]|uniref:Ferric siderophore ABC transporter substrate-binding protein n=1 Tax=Enterovibrio coralii TaxID=294935 RepID=A0A135ICR9_9GAMM|nr:energy transducer TonB [Enterovibrio coralii]KXF83205.1 ferric siderophore ABC transporter substrate-binding protein [Enterovibrio coralii]
MNARRYVVCGVVSVALHSLALSAQQPPPPQFALNDTQPGNRVAIQLVAAAPPKPEPVPEPDVQPEPVVEKKPQVEEPPKVEKAVVEPKPEPVKPKPVKKPVEAPKKKEPTPTPPKPKKEVKKQEVVEKKPEPKPKPKEEPKEKQPEEKKQEVTSDVQMNQAKDNAPVLVDRPTFKVRPSQPKYPRIAKRKGMQGTVLIEVWLDEQGNQTKQAIVQSSGFEVLDDAAMSAVQKWRFNGHEENGVPLAHRVKIPVRFNLD